MTENEICVENRDVVIQRYKANFMKDPVHKINNLVLLADRYEKKGIS